MQENYNYDAAQSHFYPPRKNNYESCRELRNDIQLIK